MTTLWLVSRRSGSARGRVFAIALAGVGTYTAKVLRSSSGPAYFDELLHLGQAQLLLGGHVFGGNSVVPVVGYYPGLQVLIAAVHYITTLSLWESDLVVIGVFHVLALLSVLLWVKELSGSERLGSLAALCYLVGPAVLFFSSEASYESVGMPMAVLTLFAATRAARGDRNWLAAAVVLSAITTVTQPVSGLFLAGSLELLGICSAVGGLARKGGKQLYPVFVGLGLLVLAMNLAWIGIFNWSETWTYLLPSLNTLGSLWHVLLRPAAGHHVFAGSSLPDYERVAGVIAIVLAFGAVVTGIVVHHFDRLGGLESKRNAGDRVLWRWSLVISLVFFLSIPLDLSPRVLVWVHRSWEFSWLGVACIIAYLLDRLLSRLPSWKSLERSAIGVLIAAASVTLLVGNSAITTNESYMFPAAYRFEFGTSMVTGGQLAAAAWMRAHAAPGARVTSDPDTDLVQWSYADETVIGAFPTWLLTFGVERSATEAAVEVDRYHLQYLIVDKLMYREVSAQGFVYSVYEPGAFSESKPIPFSAFEALLRVRWLRLEYSNLQMAIFSVVAART